LVAVLARGSAELAPVMNEPEREGVAHVVPDRGNRPAERADEADLERLLGQGRRHAERNERGRSDENPFFHVCCPPRRRAKSKIDLSGSSQEPKARPAVAFRPISCGSIRSPLLP